MIPRQCCSGSCRATTADSCCRQQNPAVHIAPLSQVSTLRLSAVSSTCARLDVTTWYSSRDAACRYSPHTAGQATQDPSVEAHERMNISVAVYHNGMRLSTTTAPLEADTLRERSKPQVEAAAMPELHMLLQQPNDISRHQATHGATLFKPQRTGRTFSDRLSRHHRWTATRAELPGPSLHEEHHILDVEPRGHS